MTDCSIDGKFKGTIQRHLLVFSYVWGTITFCDIEGELQTTPRIIPHRHCLVELETGAPDLFLNLGEALPHAGEFVGGDAFSFH